MFHARFPYCLGVGAIFILISGMAQLNAAERSVCVKCFGPDQVYNCGATTGRPISENELQLFCITRLARDYAHQTCGAERKETQCEGKTIIYAYESETAFPIKPLTQDAPAIANEDGKAEEPATLGEFTEQAVRSSKESFSQLGKKFGDAASNAGETTVNSVQNAGKAISHATKKTLKCLGSALSDC